MINPANKILKAWFELLNNNLSVPVYRYDAPATQTGNYVLLRIESAAEIRNNHQWALSVVLITEVVTKSVGSGLIEDSAAGDIDTEIGNLLYSSPAQHNLPAQDDIQIVSVSRQSQTFLPEDDGVNRLLRLITRNVHLVKQLLVES